MHQALQAIAMQGQEGLQQALQAIAMQELVVL
jgi:hypothetical protein